MENVILVILGMMIIVTAIYLPDIHTCTSWCCTSSRTGRSRSTQNDTIPYHPSLSDKNIRDFSREWGESSSGSKSGVSILENFMTSLMTLHIAHQPIYNIARLAAEVRAENGDTVKYLHKNMFPLIALSGKKGNADEIYMTSYLSQALCKTGGALIMNGMTPDSPALVAWRKLIQNDIIHWKETDLFQNQGEYWAVGTFKQINANKCASEYMYDMMKYYTTQTEDETKPVDIEQPVRYYIISREREDEIRKAYKDDKTYTITNVTSAFHAAILKILIPGISIVVEESVEKEPLYIKALQFLDLYISPDGA